MKIVKGTASAEEKRALELALKKLTDTTKRMWAAPTLRKEMPTKWR